MKLKPLFLPLAGLRRAASRGRRQNMSPFGRLSSRAGRALEALAVTGCLLGVAVPAAADLDYDPHCKQTGGTNACLWLVPKGIDSYEVRVGIDVSMGAADVEAILQDPAAFISASLWGDDGGDSDDDLLGPVPLTNNHGPFENGYSAEFLTDASGRKLNEDTSTWGEVRDEIVGKITVFFLNTGQTVTYETGVVTNYF
jgi:hypothetical protein